MAEDPQQNPQNDKRVLGIPYDWRKPTAKRFRSTMWNAEDRRVFPPKSFGAGWTVNAYWLAHPLKRLRSKPQSPRSS